MSLPWTVGRVRDRRASGAWRDVHRTHEPTATAAGCDVPRPSGDQGGGNPGVIERRLATGEGRPLSLRKRTSVSPATPWRSTSARTRPYEVVETADLVIVKGQVLADLGDVGQVRRDHHRFRTVRVGDDPFLVVAVRVDGGEPEEEGLVLGPVAEDGHPLVAAAGRRPPAAVIGERASSPSQAGTRRRSPRGRGRNGFSRRCPGATCRRRRCSSRPPSASRRT